MNIVIRTILISVFLTSLISCGGGGSNDSPQVKVTQGKFIDSAVGGITYTSGSQTGKTDSDGTFKYEDGKSVTFKVGDIVIGTVDGKAFITPVQLVSGATDQTDPGVTNIVRFLMTIDDNNNPDDGIQITPSISAAAIGKTIDFNQSIADFEGDSNVLGVVNTLTTASTSGAKSLVSSSDAQNHLSDSLFTLLSRSYSGTWKNNAGSVDGTWTFTVGPDGTVTGTGYNNFDQSKFAINGSMSTSGTMSVSSSGTAGSSTWSGSIDVTSGQMTGSWNDTTTAGAEGQGTFIGSSLAGTYSGTWQNDAGTNDGTWSLTVAHDGTVTGTSHNNFDNSDSSVTGSISTNGTITASGTVGSSTWAGTIDTSTGKMTGTWNDTALSGTEGQGSFIGYIVSARTGNYSGTWVNESATVTGTVTLTVAPDGTVTGTGHNNFDNSDFTVAGNIPTNGAITASGTAGTSAWSGSIHIGTGIMSGTWNDTTTAGTDGQGTFTATKN